MDDDKVKKESGNVDGEENEDEASSEASSDKKAISKSSSGTKEPVLDEDDDEDDDDDEEDDEDEDEYEDEEEDEEEEEEPKPRKKASASKKKPPVVKLPSELPLPPRNNEIVTGLGIAIAGYLAFWYAWSVYSLSIEKHHVNYFSHSAWAFLISFFLIVLAAFYFVRLERRDDKPTDPKKKQPYREGQEQEASKPPRKLDRLGILLAALVCGPFYVIYWWKAYDIWNSMYASDRPVMWVIYVALFGFMSLGAVHGLRPPTDEEERNRRMPGRRILMLLMTPFSLVYGMIYLASLYPPWPQ